MNNRVFIINDMNHNFDKASKYGTLVYVTEGKVPIFKTDIAKNMVRDGLDGFKESDYLLVSGPAILCMMATIIVLEILNVSLGYGEGHLKTLIFDAKEQDYVLRHLSV